MATRVGVVHGRFQPFHNEHLIYAMEAFTRCDFLFVGITNPDASEMAFHASNPHRSRETANPLAYWQRSILIDSALREAGVPGDRFCIVPFPLNHLALLGAYVPLDARFYMTIYDDWGREKRDLLVSFGLDVEVMWERDERAKGVTATLVRQRICAGELWEMLLPPAVAATMKAQSLDIQIRVLTEAATSSAKV
ncbi:MAG TPA: hypothetical protein VGD98_01145 [Ktedonobacteraceae bacterium]